MSQLSFNEFQKVSSKQWKQRIQFDLKGVDYNKTLLTETNEGITINPFYHQDQTQYLKIDMPTEPFKICQTIFLDDIEKANNIAIKALKGGASALQFEADAPFDVETFFHQFFKTNTKVPIYFKLNFLSESFVADLINQTKNFTVFVDIDSVGHLSQTGNWFYNKDKDFKILASLIKKAPEIVSVLNGNAALFQNAGANVVQQIAYTLSHLNEYFNAVAEGILPIPANKNIQINVAVGGNYFFEIAKLRVLRYLFDLLIKEYHFDFKPHILVTPSLRNKSIYDYNVNLLRTTTEYMSAILGGANTVKTLAYDAIYHKSNEFGERIARNQLLILKEESYFKDAQKALDGTYYVETISIQMAEKALQLFKEIEKKGGFVSQLFSGVIQRKISENVQKEQAQFDSGLLNLIGVNKQPNLTDKMVDNLQLYPFIKTKAHKTLVQPIITKRLAETLEQQRLAKESKS